MAQRSNHMNLSATKPFASWTWNALGVWRVYPRLSLGMSWSTWPDAPTGTSRAAAGLPQTHLVPQSPQNHWGASQSLESEQMKSPVLRAWHQSKLSSGNKQFSLTLCLPSAPITLLPGSSFWGLCCLGVPKLHLTHIIIQLSWLCWTFLAD